MVTAFKAQAVIELKQRDKSKIECVLAYGDRILLGLNTGCLRIYRVNEPSTPLPEHSSGDATLPPSDSQPAQRLTDLLHEEEKFSKRPVLQLAVIKEANVLVALTDNHVSIHDVQTYALQDKLEKTRGATQFAVTSNVDKDPETGIPTLVSRLAVAVKRKILLWSWHDMEIDPDVQELALPATVKSLTWVSGRQIMAGMDPGFTMVDIDSQDFKDINKPVVAAESAGQTTARFGAVTSSGMGYVGMSGWVPKPMAAKLSDGKVMLAKDVNTLFVDDGGNPLEKRQIPWATAPEMIGYSYPFLLALQQSTKGALEIRSPETLTLLQTIPLPAASMLHVPQPTISLAHAGKGFLVASDRNVWRMIATTYESQSRELVSQKRYDEAVSLLSMLEDTLLRDKAGQIREVQIQKAQTLFADQKFRPALDLFTDAGAPPVRVISLYPSAIAGTGVVVVDDPKMSNPTGTEELQKSPTKRNADKLKPSGKDADAASVRSTLSVTATEDVIDKIAKDKVLDGPNLKQAVLALCSFLAQSRVQIQKYLNFDGTLKDSLHARKVTDPTEVPFRNLIVYSEDISNIDWEKELFEVAKLVDTTLFRSYMFALPSLAGPLFRLDNFCDPAVVEEKLYDNGRYNDLIDFLQGKKLHRQALTLLEQFGQNKAEEEVMPALRGPNRTIMYLQQLPPELIDIVLEFSKWPLETNTKAGMEIFLADTENAESLPRDRVLDHLNKIDPDLALEYLEHIIVELSDESPAFHQMLVDMYISKLKSAPPEGDRDSYQSRLEQLLRKSSIYNKGKTFRQLPTDDAVFYESRALVLHAMGNHKQALAIYVFSMSDATKAEQYCNELHVSQQSRAAGPGTSEEELQDNIYTTLLGLYLRPPPDQPDASAQWGPALALLAAHGARLPSASTLALLPPDLAVARLASYFTRGTRRDVALLRLGRVRRGLGEVRRVAVEDELLFGDDGAGGVGGRNRRVVVGEDDHCRVCLRRFGNSAVKVWPDGTVVHYGCAGSAGRARSGGGGRAGFEGMQVGAWN